MSDTHFGFEKVDEAQKAQRVRGVFDSVAAKYDLMNDLMSLGLHRAWKAYTVAVANVREGDSGMRGIPGDFIGFGQGRMPRGPRQGRHQPLARQPHRRAPASSPT